MKYDAVAVQWADLSYSREFIVPYELPWVASNWQGDGFVHSKRITKGRRQLRFFSWLDPTQSPQSQMQGGENPVTDAVATVLSGLDQAKREGATTVLATTLALGQVKQQFALKNIDILLVKAGYEEYGEPLQEETTIVLEPGSRGMRLGRLDFQVDRGGRISSFKYTVIPLPSDVDDSPRMADWYEEYNAKVKAAYLKSIEVKKALDTGQRPYVGEQACESCHASIYNIWKKSRHADAYDALMLVNKAFDPACITCHTVGFNKEGGFIDTTLTDHLKNVQCESCHGSAREHVVSKGKTPPANATWAKKKICSQCHVPKHSPSFSLESYWPKIAH